MGYLIVFGIWFSGFIVSLLIIRWKNGLYLSRAEEYPDYETEKWYWALFSWFNVFGFVMLLIIITVLAICEVLFYKIQKFVEGK